MQTFMKIIIRFFKYLVLVAILFFVGKNIFQQIHSTKWDELTVLTHFILLSFFFEIAARFFVGLSYHFFLKSFGCALPLPASIAVSWISFFGKYLPGKIALVGSAIYFLRRYNVKTSIATIVPVMANVMTIFIAILLSFPLIFSFQNNEIALFSFGFLLVFAATSIFSIKPQAFLDFVNYIFKRYGFEKFEASLSYTQTLVCLGLITFQCFCAGMSTWMVIRAICSISITAIPQMVSITAFAGTIGMLAFFSPAGIGVRDGIYFVTLSGIIGSTNAALVTVLLRLIQTITDTGTAGIGSAIFYCNKKKYFN